RLPVQAAEPSAADSGRGARRRQRFVAGLKASAMRALRPPPMTKSSRPSQTALPPRVGIARSRRQRFVTGLYAAPRANDDGYGLPSGEEPLTKCRSSRPVHAPTGL